MTLVKDKTAKSTRAMEAGLMDPGWSLEKLVGLLEQSGSCGMNLIWKKWDEDNLVIVLVGAGWMLGGAYMLVVMGLSGPLILWLPRAIPAIFVAMGLLVLIRQFQLGPKS